MVISVSQKYSAFMQCVLPTLLNEDLFLTKMYFKCMQDQLKPTWTMQDFYILHGHTLDLTSFSNSFRESEFLKTLRIMFYIPRTLISNSLNTIVISSRIVQLQKFIERQIIALVRYLLGLLVYPVYLIIKTSGVKHPD